MKGHQVFSGWGSAIRQMIRDPQCCKVWPLLSKMTSMSSMSGSKNLTTSKFLLVTRLRRLSGSRNSTKISKVDWNWSSKRHKIWLLKPNPLNWTKPQISNPLLQVNRTTKNVRVLSRCFLWARNELGKRWPKATFKTTLDSTKKSHI